ncbi:uncharacterized protein LOC141850371 [Brevipalpus obovatus]|uniref:uncharacterized protein LOC141850371 n=1 Tax=Brevipalpus obovatus TaxID=246614 RepID=UPI003D9DB98F
MECSLIKPEIVKRLFNFIDPCDLYKCQFVCKSWYLEAMERLKKCPTIDGYSVVTTVQPKYNISKDRRSFFGTIKFIFSGKKRDLNFIFARLITYSRGKIAFQPKNGTELEKVVNNFFTQDMQCIPSFSFGCFSPPFEDVLDSIRFTFPTVKIECKQFTFFSQFQQQVPFSRQLDLPAREDGSTMFGLNIQAFHINRYAADHKVIVTDWSDPKSGKPNLDDSDYPIKSLTYFIKKGNDKLQKDIEKYFENSGVLVSGAKFEHTDRISFTTSDDRRFKFSPAISIAFAGSQVKAAVFDHIIFSQDSICENLLSELENFKQNLDFKLGGNKVIGFMFFENFGRNARVHASTKSLIWDKLVENLSGAELIAFDVSSGDSDPMKIIIHLIRICDEKSAKVQNTFVIECN